MQNRYYIVSSTWRDNASFFEPTGKVSRKRLGALVDALVALGDIPKIEIDRLVLPGVTQMAE